MLLFKTLREKCRLIENLCLEAYQASGKKASPLIHSEKLSFFTQAYT